MVRVRTIEVDVAACICNNSYLEPEFSERCEFEPAWDPHGRRLFRGCLIERSEFRSSNGCFECNQDLGRRTLIDNSAISIEEAILAYLKGQHYFL